ncbi:MAG: hypothetical protein OXL98_16405 [Acidimicrobiaceae bacterium]|nr:hypothetical protein [Acidimicrobiaceae bacterium]
MVARPVERVDESAEELPPLGPGDERRVRAWVDEAHRRITVEAIRSPAGFVAECYAAPGALAFGCSEAEARDEMRSVLFDWASLGLQCGHGLPRLGPAAVAG